MLQRYAKALFICTLVIFWNGLALIAAEVRFKAPSSAENQLWEAEKAKQEGAWHIVATTRASGGAYVQAASEEAVLEFPFEVKKEATLCVWPVWWLTGERKEAKRFPQQIPYFAVEQVWPMEWPAFGIPNTKPLPIFERTGPDVIDYYQGRLFFSAPTQGRVGIVDIGTEKVLGCIEAGGYITDLVVDNKSGKLFVSDAMNNKVFVYDAATLKKSGEIAVPDLPRSLALAGDELYVISVLGRTLTVIGASDSRIRRQEKLPFAPQHVDSTEDGKAVAVWPMFSTFDPVTLEEHPADRLQYPLSARSLRGGPIYITGKYDGYRNFSLVKEDGIRTRYTLLPKMERFDVTIDTSPATKQPKSQEAFPPPLTDDPKPDQLAFADNLMFFTSPSTGNVGVIDIDKNEYKETIRCGGYLSDIVVCTGTKYVKYLDIYGNLQYGYNETTPEKGFKRKAYAADALGNRVIVIDAATLKVEREISVPKMPVSLCLYEPHLFVTCREDKCVAVVDVARDEIVKRIDLPATPVGAEMYRLQPSYASTESYAPKSISPLRFVVGFEPVGYDAATLQPCVVKDLPLLYKRRAQVQAAGKKFFADNMHTIHVDGTRWIDVSSITDRRLSEEPARLGESDVPGTITLSLDGGEECDWTRGIWSTPDYRLLLRSGDEEFIRWNAVRFHVAPGTHVLRVRTHSPFARLDALRVQKTPENAVAMTIRPEPQEVHREAPLPTYQAVFAHGEPVSFTISLKNLMPRRIPVSLEYSCTDYMGETVKRGKEQLALVPTESQALPLKVETDRTGVFHLTLSLRSDEGVMSKDFHFLRLPALANPCVIFRAEDIERIKERIRNYAGLFEKYKSWLKRRCSEEGFLPTTLVGSGQKHDVEVQRWHAVLCQFAAMFLGDEDGLFASRLTPLTAKSGSYSSQQTDFQFGGALACIMDMQAASSNEARQHMEKLFNNALLMETLVPESLLMVREPLTPQTRAALNRHMADVLNYERYFTAHAGKRGGNLWQDTRHNCACPEHSIFRIFLFYRNFFGMSSLFEKPIFSGYFTHFDYVMPWYDQANYLGGGPRYTPMKQIAMGLSRNPLEQWRNHFNDLIKQLNNASQDEFDQLVDEGANFAVPLMLALAWLDQAAPGVTWEELPPSAFFDGEGAAAMKSGWDENTTDIYFVSGLRDVCYRVQPNHFQLFKAGRMLIGTAAMAGDHGNPVQYWGNVVVVGNDWPEWWGQKWHPRMDERRVINRFAPETLGYAMRDYRLSGFMPSNYNWFFSGGHGYGYYDISLHSHTRHPFMKDGQVLAYETWPQFDYVASDAANAWPLDQVSEMYRQLVFIRPDVVVIYDRVALGPKGGGTAWISAVAPTLNIEKNFFTVSNDKARLLAEVLMPQEGKVAPLNLSGKYPYPAAQKTFVQIVPANRTSLAEYLVLMQTGVADPTSLSPSLECNDRTAALNFAYGNKKISIQFNRVGDVGGKIAIQEGWRTLRHDFAGKIDDSYHNWKSYPLYKRWTTEPAFRFLVKD